MTIMIGMLWSLFLSLARENSNQIRLSGIDKSYHFKTISIFLRTLCNYAISPLKIWNSLLRTMASIAELLRNYLDFPVNTTFTYTVTLWVYVTSLTYFGRYLYNIIHIITSIVKVKPNSSKGTFQTRFGHSKKKHPTRNHHITCSITKITFLKLVIFKKERDMNI